MSFSIGLCIPTFNPDSRLVQIINSVLSLSLDVIVLIWDSSSREWDFEMPNNPKIIINKISQNEFNHGATRELARKQINTDIIIFMTQDATPVNSNVFEKLIQPILDGNVVATYGRQLSHDGAEILESFPREFNYPKFSQEKKLSLTSQLGAFTFFFSDSFSAYLNAALDEIGGFLPTLTWEDYFASARLQIKDYSIKYVAEAEVIHSHNYTLYQEFKRYFDAGYVRRQNQWLSEYIKNAEGRGVLFLKGLLKTIIKNHKYYLIPYALLQTLVKLLGYRVGYYSLHAPIWFKKICSEQNYYWSSKYYDNNEVKLWK